MSDVKPRRTPREAVRGEFTPSEPAPAETAVAIVPETPPAVATAEISEPPAATTAPNATTNPAASAATTAEDAWAVFTEAQAALTRGFEEIAAEFSGLSQSSFTASSDAAIALLGARTFAEVVEINAGLARRGIDTMIGGSAKLSEITVKSLSEASRPVLARLNQNWGKLSGVEPA